MTAEEHQILLLREIFRNILIESLSLGSHVDHTRFLSDLLDKCLISAVDRLRLHDHPGAAAVRIVVHLSVALQRIIADIHRLKRYDPLRCRAAENAGLQTVHDHLRE